MTAAAVPLAGVLATMTPPPRISQRADELSAFIELLQREGVRSYLEVGARHGVSFAAVMRALPAGAKGVAIDLPASPWGERGSREVLEEVTAELCGEGYDASAIFGNSVSAATQQTAAIRGPYDAVFIDGDHRLEAVTRDWLAYGPLGRLVAFHDIDGAGKSTRSKSCRVEVPSLWRSIKRAHRHVEIIGVRRGMGIGVLWR